MQVLLLYMVVHASFFLCILVHARLTSLYIIACKFFFLFIVMIGLLLCILVHTSFASLYVCACEFCFSLY